jgi:glutamate/tyrosine decarboxylase-like PLP-dependent enzyme
MLKACGAGTASLLLGSHLFPLLTAGELEQAVAGTCAINTEDASVRAMLTSAPEGAPACAEALFLGPRAENAELMEDLLVRAFRDHAFWRRNFHPEDKDAIRAAERRSPDYLVSAQRMEDDLFELLGRLKQGAPFHSPRYIGHMNSDVLLPAIVGYIAAMLYNQNNVSWEGAPVTTLLEVQVGREMARMLGMATKQEELCATWGHITSGGTLANIEAIWAAKALKFLPVAVRQAAKELGVKDLDAGLGKALEACSAWELVNLTPTRALDLKDALLKRYVERAGTPPMIALAKAQAAINANDILSLGDHEFYSRLAAQGDALGAPTMFVPQTKHYSWVKGPGVLGLGSAQCLQIPIDDNYRLDVLALERRLDQMAQAKRPVVMGVAVLGTTEEGAVDPMKELVALRQRLREKGLSFFLHCDAAYGGYLGACFRRKDGALRPLEEMRKEYGGWPEPEVYESFKALGQFDSATVDPHKLGYVPYPAGAIVFRDGRVKDLLAQDAPYALGDSGPKNPGEFYIGKYILEGSKPGAAAAAVFLAHRAVTPDEHGYGKLLGRTIRTARGLHERLRVLAKAVQAEFVVEPLALPDTNIVDYLFNIKGNQRLDVMNRFGKALYAELALAPLLPLQTRNFIVSRTEFGYETYNPEVVKRLLKRLGVDPAYLVPIEQARAAQGGGYADEVLVFRTVCMNPFSEDEAQEGKNYLDLFVDGLPALMRKAKKAV